jgi:hypothetical protein
VIALHELVVIGGVNPMLQRHTHAMHAGTVQILKTKDIITTLGT